MKSYAYWKPSIKNGSNQPPFPWQIQHCSEAVYSMNIDTWIPRLEQTILFPLFSPYLHALIRTLAIPEQSVCTAVLLTSNIISFQILIKMAVCHGCEEPISDQFILRVSPDLQWHSSCLRCSQCNVSLSGLPSCYVKNGKPFCKSDYEK